MVLEGKRDMCSSASQSWVMSLAGGANKKAKWSSQPWCCYFNNLVLISMWSPPFLEMALARTKQNKRHMGFWRRYTAKQYDKLWLHLMSHASQKGTGGRPDKVVKVLVNPLCEHVLVLKMLSRPAPSEYCFSFTSQLRIYYVWNNFYLFLLSQDRSRHMHITAGYLVSEIMLSSRSKTFSCIPAKMWTDEHTVTLRMQTLKWVLEAKQSSARARHLHGRRTLWRLAEMDAGRPPGKGQARAEMHCFIAWRIIDQLAALCYLHSTSTSA